MTLLLSLAASALLAQAAPAPPQITIAPAELPIAQQTALRCSVAIAIATEQQRSGRPEAAQWPDLVIRERGREFFVRNIAKLMDDTGMTREALAIMGRAEAERMRDGGVLTQTMPACLLLLDASGL